MSEKAHKLILEQIDDLCEHSASSGELEYLLSKVHSRLELLENMAMTDDDRREVADELSKLAQRHVGEGVESDIFNRFLDGTVHRLLADSE